MTSIGDKVRYVRGQPGDGRHTCHWPGCTVVVAPALWGCPAHWKALPQNLRTRIWKTYRPGQEIDKRPSAAYVEVAQAVQRWIKSNHPTQGRLL